jgi:hypothetical protein
MITIMVRHKVADYAKWKAVFDNARPTRREAGEIACRVYVRHGSANDVVVSLDWDSLERAQSFLASMTLMSGMNEAGVREMPQITVLERRDEYSL